MRTATVAALTGISYRQLDYLTRHPDTAPHIDHRAQGHGAGNARWWAPHLVRRLILAQAVQEAFPQLALPAVARPLLEAPFPPPDRGWLVLDTDPDQPVTYVADQFDLADALPAVGAALVLPYDLAALVTDRAPHLAEGLLTTA
jgi:hypothetical protein